MLCDIDARQYDTFHVLLSGKHSILVNQASNDPYCIITINQPAKSTEIRYSLNKYVDRVT